MILLGVLSCAGQSTEILNTSSSTNNTDSYIITGSWDANHRAVTYYDINGNYLRHVDFRTEGITPRGLTLMNDTILVSGEGNDSIYALDLQGNKSLFFGAATLNGAIFDIEYDPVGQVIYVAESDNIEAFSSDGIRLTSQRIPTNSGACTLDNVGGLDIDASGRLIVSTTASGDEILVYDITTSPPTCISANDFGGNPYGIVAHSDGNLYVAQQGPDEIVRADLDGLNPTVIFAANTAVINNPEAIAEMPDGNLIVSSTATDTLEIIQTDGTRVGTNPFIQDALSLRIGSILVINGSSP